MEEVEIWLARDEDNSLWAFSGCDIYKDEEEEAWLNLNNGDCLELDNKLFPNIQWEDKEPTKAKITLIK